MPTAPGFHKGQTVTARPEVPFRGHRWGVRPATKAEQDAWYKEQYAIAPHDCAGESWIHDGSTSILLTPGTPLTVKRGRCTAYHGWMTRKGYCEVTDAVGNTFKVDRRDLELAKGKS